MTHFWNVTHHYFNEASGADNWGNHYWSQAHALDVLIDAYLRSGDDFYNKQPHVSYNQGTFGMRMVEA